MGYEKDLTGKATLAAEDIRFARTIERIQRILISELTKIALVHLYAQGYTDESLTNFELSLTTPSIIYDQERTALMKEIVISNLMRAKNKQSFFALHQIQSKIKSLYPDVRVEFYILWDNTVEGDLGDNDKWSQLIDQHIENLYSYA